MKKWAFLCAAAAGAAVIGCGGHGGGTGPANVTTGRAPAATVTLNPGGANPLGLVYVAFLTGQGRAQGDLYMNITRAQMFDSFNGISASRADLTPRPIHLVAYTIQYVTLDVPLATIANNTNSETFNFFTLAPYSFGQEQANGSVGLNPGDPGYFGVGNGMPQDIPAHVTAFPGRDSILPIFVDDSDFTMNGAAVDFNYANFQQFNTPITSDPVTSGKMVGLISDFVRFDISHIPAGNVPTLQVDGQPATHFYFSGDNSAMSDDTPSSPRSHFEELTLDPTNPIDGFMAPPHGSSGSPVISGFPGTYDLTQANPTDLTGQSKIFSLFGRWRESTDVLNLNATTFDIIIFPNSKELYTENSPTDAVAIVHNGPTITNLYAGFAFFSPNSGDKPTVKLFPLPNFVSGSVAGEVDYTLSAFTNSNGVTTTDEPSIRNGTYGTPVGTPPAGFLNTGTFVVFR